MIGRAHRQKDQPSGHLLVALLWLKTDYFPGGIRLDSDEGQMGSRARDEVKSLDKTIEQLAATAQQQQQANRLVKV